MAAAWRDILRSKMPLLDGGGNPLLAGGDPLETAAFGSADAFYTTVVNWAIEQLLEWVASGALDFFGPAVDFGPLAGPVRFQRYHFHGLAATLQISGDGSNWHDTLTVDFGADVLENILNLVDRLVDLVFYVTHAAVEAGAQLLAAGVLYTSEEEPMVAIAVGNVKKLIVSMLEFEQPFQLSFHLRKTNTASSATGEADLIGDFRTNVEAELLACIAADVAILNYKVEDRISGGTTNGRLRTFTGDTLSAVVGTGGAANTNNAPQLAGCLSWYTNFAGRGERGRSYLPGLPNAFYNDGRLAAGAVTAYEAFRDAILARYDGDTDNTAPYQLVLWRQHLTGAGASDPNPVTSPPGTVPVVYGTPPVTRPPFNPLAAAHGITAGTVQSTVRVQRRRGIGVRIGRR